MNTEEFIEKARTIHNNKYDYSKVIYKNNRTKVCIICPEHGEFWQTPNAHLRGSGCRICSIKLIKEKQKLSTEDFIEKAIKIHGNKYDYSKVNYINYQTKVCIICHEKDENGNEHGEFWQIPLNHLKGKGCPSCYGNKKKNTEEFIKEAREVHGNKYDYSKVEYKNCDTKVCIICPEHGEFWQTPYKHIIRKQGCCKCGGHFLYNNGIFKECAKKVHGDKYDYSKAEYVNSKTKVCIICPKHGEFWQAPNHHLNGEGCPSCKESQLEESCRVFFEENNIKFLYRQKPKWLKGLELDFYLPEYNIAIECQGIQHFEPTDFGFKDKEKTFKNFEKIQKYNSIKKELCKNEKIKLYYINYNEKNIKDKLKKIVFKYGKH